MRIGKGRSCHPIAIPNVSWGCQALRGMGLKNNIPVPSARSQNASGRSGSDTLPKGTSPLQNFSFAFAFNPDFFEDVSIALLKSHRHWVSLRGPGQRIPQLEAAERPQLLLQPEEGRGRRAERERGTENAGACSRCPPRDVPAWAAGRSFSIPRGLC